VSRVGIPVENQQVRVFWPEDWYLFGMIAVGFGRVVHAGACMIPYRTGYGKSRERVKVVGVVRRGGMVIPLMRVVVCGVWWARGAGFGMVPVRAWCSVVVVVGGVVRECEFREVGKYDCFGLTHSHKHITLITSKMTNNKLKGNTYAAEYR
jgi:hypothetical protein